MIPTQKSSNAITICCFVVGIVVMSIISIKSFNIYDIGYLLILVFYFMRYLYLLKTENKGIDNK